MTIDNVVDLLYEKIPQMKNVVKEEGDYIEGLPYMIFSIAFVKYVVLCFNSKDDCLAACISFMEEMAEADVDIQELLTVSVIEELLQERTLLENIKMSCSCKLRQEIIRTEKFYGWD